jgi:hypothetical protein
LFPKFLAAPTIKEPSRPQLLFGAYSLTALAAAYPDKLK